MADAIDRLFGVLDSAGPRVWTSVRNDAIRGLMTLAKDDEDPAARERVVDGLLARRGSVDACFAARDALKLDLFTPAQYEQFVTIVTTGDLSYSFAYDAVLKSPLATDGVRRRLLEHTLAHVEASIAAGRTPSDADAVSETDALEIVARTVPGHVDRCTRLLLSDRYVHYPRNVLSSPLAWNLAELEPETARALRDSAVRMLDTPPPIPAFAAMVLRHLRLAGVLENEADVVERMRAVPRVGPNLVKNFVRPAAVNIRV